jgi:3-hydroxyacyl-[acyl-carrier-protein] dehydratase
MDKQTILKLLPYTEPFLFVDTLEVVTEDEVVGYYTYPEDAFFYRGHFKDHPVTPGVILTETMAQIGLVCMGIYLLRDKIADGLEPGLAFSSQEVDYYKAVYPGEKVKVYAKKEYFRFGKLKCKVEMHNAAGELVCKGVLAGMGRVV